MIPNRFHFVFGLKRQTEPFHLVHYLCLASCLAVNSPDAIYFYYHHEPYGRYWDLIQEKLVLVKIPSVDFIDTYPYRDRRVARYKYAHASDFVRLEKLVSHGGIYADMDTLFVNPIPPALYEKRFVLGREDDIQDPATGEWRPSVCNAFIMSERNAPFGRLWLENIHAAFDGTWSKHSTLLTHELTTRHPELVHLEPRRTFYKHMWTREGLHTLLEGLDADNAGVVSFHLWAHLWWAWHRNDFSHFHKGKITEDFVSNTDTTYNVVARRFLPPREPHSFLLQQTANLKRQASGIMQRVGSEIRKVAVKPYILAKLAAFSVLKEDVFPRATEHFDYAVRQWKHPYVRTLFRSRNHFEREAVLDSVAYWDEYRIEHLKFAPGDVILDVGAHVGIFSYMCYLNGSRAIYAYEPEIGNFQQLAKHVGGFAGIELLNLAVFRSDEPVNGLVHSGYFGDNTGAGNVLLRGGVVDINEQTIEPNVMPLQAVEAIPLDEMLEKFEQVRLLKLDCEGSEFPILLTSRLLTRVQEILGEYHEIEPELYARLDPAARIENFSAFRAHDLVNYLESQGMSVYVEPRAPFMGYFRATRQNDDKNG